MGLFKKKKTFTSTDSASLFDPDQITDAQQIKKQAVKQWIFEGSQRPLHDYLLAASNNGLKARWDRLYDLVQNKNIYSEYRWNYSSKYIPQLNWKKGAELYLREKFPNQISEFLHIDHGDLRDLPTVEEEVRKRFKFSQVNTKHFHEILIQSNTNYVVVLVGSDYTLPSMFYNLTTYINKPYFLGYIDPKEGIVKSPDSLQRGYYLTNEKNFNDIPELANYPRVRALSKESYNFIKFRKIDYENLIHERLHENNTPTAELIALDAKVFLNDIPSSYIPQPFAEDNDEKPYEWFGAEFLNKQGKAQTYYEYIPDLRDHRIAELARSKVTKFSVAMYPPIPIRVSNHDMDGDSNLLSGNSSWGKLFLNTARRNQQLQGAADRLRYDRVYAAEALAILGFDIKELISSFRDSVGGDWGKLDEVWIYLTLPTPFNKSDYDDPTVNKYWILYNYLATKLYVNNYFKINQRHSYKSYGYMYNSPINQWAVKEASFEASSNKFQVRINIEDVARGGFLSNGLNLRNNYRNSVKDYVANSGSVPNYSGKEVFDIPKELLEYKIHYSGNPSNIHSSHVWFVPYNLYPYNKIVRAVSLPTLGGFARLEGASFNGFKRIGDITRHQPRIPIFKELLKYFSKTEQDILLQYAMQIHTYSEETVKVYRGWVKPFVKFGAIIVGIAVAVASSGGDGGSTYTALVALAKSIAVSIAINVVVKIAVSVGLISPKLAGYLQLVISVVMMAHGAGWDFSKILTAPNIMTAVNQAFNAYNKQKVFEIAETYKQIQDETVKYQTKMEELQAKQQMVDLGVAKDAQLYLNMPSYAPKVNLFETPEMMYARHDNINIVNISLGIVTNLSHGLLSKQQTPKLETVRDIQQEVEDVLLIT
ncbi:hypothetical protein [Moraxella canis]|uniref:Uncharacterized protein n=1 Tax=Moraxella canis TaxID=90239 RepID=A0A1S9ZNH2_9GAMM|nr:hypothetical protein [Moraxella canis]OOR84913.1 hypothetical protein B0180_02060 [Moraxella canis]